MKTVFGVMRLPFLILGPACVFAAMALAIHDKGSVSVLWAVLCFVGGILAHIAVNALNEYDDFKSGLDLKTNPTPFSGGSGTLKKYPTQAILALITGIVASILVFAIGLYFFTFRGWPIVFIGLLGLFIIGIYTPILNRYPFWCLVAPGLGFGTLMVLGSYFVLTGRFTLPAVLVSFIPFFLVSNLLLLNEFPDVDADKTIGRRHFPILIGRKASAWIFAAFNAATYLVILLAVIFGLFPAWTLLGLLTLIFAVPNSIKVLRNANDLPALIPSLPVNVLVNILTPVLVGIGFLIH